MFLIRIRKPRVAHIFTGKDTACRLLSTGGLKRENYTVVKTINLPICIMCICIMCNRGAHTTNNNETAAINTETGQPVGYTHSTGAMPGGQSITLYAKGHQIGSMKRRGAIFDVWNGVGDKLLPLSGIMTMQELSDYLIFSTFALLPHELKQKEI